MKRYFFSILLPLVILSADKSKAQIKDVGPITTYSKTKHGIIGKTNEALFELDCYSPGTIRVRVTRQSAFRNFSYALESDSIPSFKSFTISDDKEKIILETSLLQTEIIKHPEFRVVFKNKSGLVINEDESGKGFGTTFFGNKVSVYKKLQDGEKFVGLGEALGPLNRRGMGITLNNTDTYKYGDDRMPMYSSIPFYIGIHHHTLYGLFFNNTYRTYVNFGQSTPDFLSVNMDGGDADYFFFYGKNMPEVIAGYTAVTGRIPMPPLWSLGYQQSRCSYYPQEKVLDVARSLRQRKFPSDGIVLDADYLKEYEPFRINKERFPNLTELVKELKVMNFEVTASVNPGIKIDSTYDAHVDGLKQDVFVRYGNGKLFVSDIAPSTNHYVDFTKPKARNWWIDKMRFLPDAGIHGYWNDMNEPALGGSYLPDNLLFDFDGFKANSLEAKNVYGMQMARSSYLSALRYAPEKRPFVLSRSGFAGMQRYAAIWSGDNTNNDEGLLTSVLLNNQLGISGMPFCGYDVGGYIGDGNPQLFARWMQIGAFSPYCRNHRGFFFQANEPWSYGEETEAIAKAYMKFRYRLMPYLYDAFHESTLSGMPVARGLCVRFPFDEKVYDRSFQYHSLFGNEMMFVPVTSQEKYTKIYLPEGLWYDIYTDEAFSGNQEMIQESCQWKLPVYVSESAIIPMQHQVYATAEKPSDTLDVHIYYGDHSNSHLLYQDNGKDFSYQNGDSLTHLIQYHPKAKTISIENLGGSHASSYRHIKWVLHGFPTLKDNTKVNGIQSNCFQSFDKTFDPLSELSDFYDPSYYLSLKMKYKSVMVQTMVTIFPSTQLTINWQ